MDFNNEIFKLYKPFRNHIGKARLLDSLLAIHAHSQFQQFNQPIPNYIYNLPVGYTSITSFEESMQYHIFPWELQLIVRELILNGQFCGGKKTYLNWNHLADAVNRLKAVEDSISKIYITKENVLVELMRISHRMFHLQHKPNNQDLARYWFLYKEPELEKLIYKTIELSVDEIFIISLILTGFYIDKFALNYPPRINLQGLSFEQMNKYFSHFSITYETLKGKLKHEQRYNSNFIYTFNSYYQYPLIRLPFHEKDSLVCPIPRLLIERFTKGLYYEIYNSNNFDHIFGEAYQNYIGKLLLKVFATKEITPEASYKTKYGESKTVDWIIDDESASLFIECKTKRLTLGAKTGLLDLTELEKELDKMADFVLQVYKSLIEYKHSQYPQYRYIAHKNVYILIVTLEEWFLFGDKLLNQLNKIVHQKLNKNGISLEVLHEHPYLIASTEDFEKFIQICKKVTIRKVVETKVSTKDKAMWHLSNFLISEFKEEYLQTKPLLKTEYNELTENLIKKYSVSPQ